ncbi:diguanylate phosphodiesterase [Bradyrhizobium guangdongense]|uniref:EAL domain-containing response regulator n=1 Tax=Bradyrhizobium guangdongense TaxID=1325090 RepID=UPI001128F170|nr:EAL domain-containing response regulator [Bradyrhizobium guangdongense]TPQ39624.1 diguanylate phosphodiesterase [Bradyrhizobium guangdongense]
MRVIARQTTESMGRLLVVDDDLVQRSIIGKIGAKLGYDTVTASSFEVAAGLLQRGAFDVMTLDLSLGEHDGVELLRIVADRGLHAMSIVIISGCDDRILNSTKRFANGLRLSVAAGLTKPLDLDQLRDALQSRRSAAAVAATDQTSANITPERIATAIARGELCVEFQPKVDIVSGRVVGAEALARWCARDLGIVSPAVFIPMAEQCGLMPAMTDCILSSAIAQGRKLIERNPGFTIAVNVSAALMSDLALPERIEDILRREQVPAHALIVEMTETTAMADVDRAIDILVRLRIKNIGAAIDDFGTGYSSLAALARLPFNELKIDQCFVKGCETDDDMMKIIDASVGLARAFNMKVVAEGVDSPEALARVRHAGCDIAQGYFFAPSLKLARAENWVSQRNAFVAQHSLFVDRSTEPNGDGGRLAG